MASLRLQRNWLTAGLRSESYCESIPSRARIWCMSSIEIMESCICFLSFSFTSTSVPLLSSCFRMSGFCSWFIFICSNA